MDTVTFADRLTLVMKALSMSRGQLGAALNVDKSLVGRWAAGAVTPSAHNLTRLTHLITERRPGFTLLDWERDLSSLANLFGVSVPSSASSPGSSDAEGTLGEWIPLQVLRQAKAATMARGSAYEGIWRSTRPSAELPGRFLHDHILIRRQSNGMLSFELRMHDMHFSGWSLLLQNQLFSIATDQDTGTFIFSIFNGVARQKAQVLDGLTLSCLRDAGGTPVAGACLMERVADLTQDEEADEALYRSLYKSNPVAPEGSIPKKVREHLFHDVGPTSLAAGGDPMLLMHFGRTMSRGPSLEELDDSLSIDDRRVSLSSEGAVLLRPTFGRPKT